MRWCCAAFVLGLLPMGCVNELRTSVTKARLVGDTTYVRLPSTVVSVPVGAQDASYRNLHVGLSALIRKKNAMSTALASDVRKIMERMAPRLAGHVVEVVSRTQLKAPGDLDKLREQLAKGARTVVHKGFSGWEWADDFEVEWVVSELYLTDLSIGGPRHERHGLTYY